MDLVEALLGDGALSKVIGEQVGLDSSQVSSVLGALAPCLEKV